MNYLATHAGVLTINLGTGKGCSVLELVNTFAEVSGQAIPYKVVARRPGDVAQYYADTALARNLIGWEAKRSIAQMCADAWRWQKEM
jgi:UDP-glucose 4-epimerase